MTRDIISSHFEKAQALLKSEHDLMIQKIKEEISQIKQKALSKI